jgi:hypothetical protein
MSELTHLFAVRRLLLELLLSKFPQGWRKCKCCDEIDIISVKVVAFVFICYCLRCLSASFQLNKVTRC